jgi:hypothetical protein
VGQHIKNCACLKIYITKIMQMISAENDVQMCLAANRYRVHNSGGDVENTVVLSRAEIRHTKQQLSIETPIPAAHSDILLEFEFQI